MRNILLVLCLFLAVLPVMAQSNPVTNGSFEELDATGWAVDWSRMGDVTINQDSHTGKNAVLISRNDPSPAEIGMNRDWMPESGQQGSMLAELKGAIRFHYKVLTAVNPANSGVYVIAMSAAGIENTGASRIPYIFPAEHTGDGQWHEGIIGYDFTGNIKAQWIHISPRLYGPNVEVLLDDFEYLPSAGPLPTIYKTELSEIPGKEGREALITVKLTNAGDAPINDGVVKINVAKGLKVDEGVTRTVPLLNPERYTQLTFRVIGNRASRGYIGVEFSSGGRCVTRKIIYAPELEIVSFTPQTVVTTVDRHAVFTLRLRNHGHAVADHITAELRPQAPLPQSDEHQKILPALAPQKETSIAWKITPTQQIQNAQVAVTVDALGIERQRAETSLVVGPEMPTMQALENVFPQASAGSQVFVSDDLAIIGNQHVRLIFPHTTWGFGVAQLQQKINKTWVAIGTLPRMTRLVTAGSELALQEQFVYASNVIDVPSPQAVAPEMLTRGLQLVASLKDASDITWQIKQTWRLEPQASMFDVSTEAIPDANASLRALDGVMFYAGDASPLMRKDAIFPGLEWLDTGEVSSSTLDIAKGHEDQVRHVPDPRMITFPLMCARFTDKSGSGTVISLTWDNLASYYADYNHPSAVFSSPDALTGKDVTLLGLFVPSMPEFISRNQLTAHTAMDVKAGEAVRLDCQLAVQPTTSDDTSLLAVKNWFMAHSLPEIHPLPHGKTWLDEVEFSMGAYLNSLWLPEEEKWMPSIGGPAVYSTPQHHPWFMYDMRMYSDIAQGGKQRQAVLDRLALVAQKGAPPPQGDDLGFQYFGPGKPLISHASFMASLRQSQTKDGSWRFKSRIEESGVFKGMDYAEIGPDNVSEVGTSALSAFYLLQFANITGDVMARNAGLKALDFIEQFEVPRAAQVWEVPVHTPDILASSDACEAYLEAYRLTGEQKYLDKAIYWAWTGMPFVYMWDKPGMEWLRYATIPVFGATWYTGSWFGRPVQWNGLRYAYAVHKLAQYDTTFDWKKIAEGITVCGHYWQSDKEKDLALWPDNIGVIPGDRCGWVFAPYMILKNSFSLMGYEAAPVTIAVGPEDQQFRLTTVGKFIESKLEGSILSARINFERPQTGYLLIANSSRPTEVLVNGQITAQVPDFNNSPETCWRYYDEQGLLEIKLGRTGPNEVKLTGVSFEPTRMYPKPLKNINFDFAQTAEGWQPMSHLTPFVISDGVLTASTLDWDPFMVRENLDVQAANAKTLKIRMALDTGMDSNAAIYWTTDENPGQAEDKTLHFTTVPDGEFHEYSIDMAQHPNWSNVITSLRIDPCGPKQLGMVKIDWIKAY